MVFEVVDGVRVLELNMIITAALAAVLLMIGYALRRKFTVLERFAIPAPVIGGFILAIITLICHQTGILTFKLDTGLQLPFMLIFFTCIGFGGSFKLLKAGGKVLLVFLCLCWGLAIVQNVVGVSLASLLGLNPVLGVMAGTVSLVGGHGNAAAFGPVAEDLGVQGATAVAIASATFGLIVGSLMGGPVGDYLIRKRKVKIETSEDSEVVRTEDSKEVLNVNEVKKAEEKEKPVTPYTVLTHLSLIFVFMGIGLLIGTFLDSLKIPNFSLPSYVGAMFVAIVFRNINDKFHIYEINHKVIGYFLEVGIGFFLTMAIMTLRIWELADLAIPLILILIVQTIIVLLITVFIAFRVLGKDYDAAVMSGGYMGWGVGVSATAVACMGSICEKYGKVSTKSFLIVPLSGAVFVDIVGIPIIVFFINYFS